MYKLNRKVFMGLNSRDADSLMTRYGILPVYEYLRIAMYLNSVAFDFPIGKMPKMDRNCFQARARKTPPYGKHIQ